MLFQARQPSLKEAFAPQADDLPAGVQALGDLVIGETFGGMKDHSGANHMEIWQRIFGGSCFEFTAFIGAKNNDKWARSWHDQACHKSAFSATLIR
jgi:hypothetical protein